MKYAIKKGVDLYNRFHCQTVQFKCNYLHIFTVSNNVVQGKLKLSILSYLKSWYNTLENEDLSQIILTALQN